MYHGKKSLQSGIQNFSFLFFEMRVSNGWYRVAFRVRYAVSACRSLLGAERLRIQFKKIFILC